MIIINNVTAILHYFVAPRAAFVRQQQQSCYIITVTIIAINVSLTLFDYEALSLHFLFVSPFRPSSAYFLCPTPPRPAVCRPDELDTMNKAITPTPLLVGYCVPNDETIGDVNAPNNTSAEIKQSDNFLLFLYCRPLHWLS